MPATRAIGVSNRLRIDSRAKARAKAKCARQTRTAVSSAALERAYVRKSSNEIDITHRFLEQRSRFAPAPIHLRWRKCTRLATILRGLAGPCGSASLSDLRPLSLASLAQVPQGGIYQRRFCQGERDTHDDGDNGERDVRPGWPAGGRSAREKHSRYDEEDRCHARFLPFVAKRRTVVRRQSRPPNHLASVAHRRPIMAFAAPLSLAQVFFRRQVARRTRNLVRWGARQWTDEERRRVGSDRLAEIVPAIREVIEGVAEGRSLCATLEVNGNPDSWVQVTPGAINIAYPLHEDPSSLPKRLRLGPPGALNLVEWEAGAFATFNIDAPLSIREIARIVDEMFESVLGCKGQNYSVHVEIIVLASE
jgi:hypothetical protein